MGYRIEKTESGPEIVFDEWEKGIATSPHKGIANMQNVNISTETGEVMCSYARTQQSQTNTTTTSGVIGPVDSTHLSLTLPNSIATLAGIWIIVANSTISGLSNGNYYIANNINNNSAQLSNFYNSAVLTGLGLTGTASFSILRNFGQPISQATEKYTSSGVFKYRYYILDANGLVWVYDTATSGVTSGLSWFLPDFNLVTGATGIAILNGWLHVFSGSIIWCKPTVNLGDSTSTSSNYVKFAQGNMLTSNIHYAISGHQGRIYYTDGNFIGSIFPNTSLLSGTANIQSYASYTGSGTTGTISQLLSGTVPYNGTDNSKRIPAVFFHALTTSAANPNATTLGTIYYIKYLPQNSGFTDTSTFEVYAAEAGGSALNLATGAVGTQYFSTYYPTSAGGEATLVFTPEALNLPFFETAQCMCEVGNTVLIGCDGSIVYPWNQIDVTPGDLISLPENNVSSMVNVNNMAYIFAGNKANIYITNGSSASPVISVPDYCAGIAGSASSYIEPYFTWGGSMYVRGRVYFSLLDQTASKTGNCGGVWSFIPTQNLFFGEDVGLSLRLENQNSYATYNGVATVLLPSQNQAGTGVQYWSGWYSSITSPSYGIDFTGTLPSTAVIETDLIPVGTILGQQKRTFSNLEYKLATPLVTGESVTIGFRENRNAAYVSAGTVHKDSSLLSGYISPLKFQGKQYLQFQLTLNSAQNSTATFCPLTELRLR